MFPIFLLLVGKGVLCGLLHGGVDVVGRKGEDAAAAAAGEVVAVKIVLAVGFSKGEGPGSLTGDQECGTGACGGKDAAVEGVGTVDVGSVGAVEGIEII